MATVGGLGLLTLRLVVQRGQLKRADTWARLLVAATEQTGDLIVIARADGSRRVRERRVPARGGIQPPRALVAQVSAACSRLRS